MKYTYFRWFSLIRLYEPNQAFMLAKLQTCDLRVCQGVCIQKLFAYLMKQMQSTCSLLAYVPYEL